MKDTKDITALVVDHGIFVPLAAKLAQVYKRVLYYSPWEEGFPKLNKALLGYGYDNVERCNDIWDVMPDVDLCVFPDIQHSGLQLHLESIGKAVWGSRKGDILELNRPFFLQTLEALDLPTPGWVVVQGLTALREYLKKHEDLFVKVSKYRGLIETFHHTDYRETEPILDRLAVQLGPARELMKFIVIEPIETDIELGWDGYSIDGKWPDRCVHGIEAKDMSYCGWMTDYDDFPEQVRVINDAFGPVLAEYRYRNFFSTEIRVKDDKPYFLDPACRCPSPAIESQIELYGNLAEIIWAGANGELINPEPTAEWAVQVIAKLKCKEHEWGIVDVPPSVRPWFKGLMSCVIDDRICWPPDDDIHQDAGWIVGIGDTAEEAITALKKHIADLGDAPLKIELHPLVSLLQEIESAESQGIPMTNDTLPEPTSVLES